MQASDIKKRLKINQTGLRNDININCFCRIAHSEIYYTLSNDFYIYLAVVHREFRIMLMERSLCW